LCTPRGLTLEVSCQTQPRHVVLFPQPRSVLSGGTACDSQTASLAPVPHHISESTMHLAKLQLKNFRSCVDTTVHFQEDLTILVGENNGGKTGVLDALRLITTPSDGRRTRYPDVRDVHRDAPDSSICLGARFEALSQSQKGWFITALTSPVE